MGVPHPSGGELLGRSYGFALAVWFQKKTFSVSKEEKVKYFSGYQSRNSRKKMWKQRWMPTIPRLRDIL